MRFCIHAKTHGSPAGPRRGCLPAARGREPIRSFAITSIGVPSGSMPESPGTRRRNPDRPARHGSRRSITLSTRDRGVAVAGKRRLHHGRGHQVEIVSGDLGTRVLVGDHLSLLGDPDVPPHRAARLREDRRMRRTAASGHRPAPAVEEPELEPVGRGLVLEHALRLVQDPVAREVAAVLSGIRVADHDLLKSPPVLELPAVHRRAVQALHHVAGPAKVLDRLEQRAPRRVTGGSTVPARAAP
jgi:hypothetical protein